MYIATLQNWHLLSMLARQGQCRKMDITHQKEKREEAGIGSRVKGLRHCHFFYRGGRNYLDKRRFIKLHFPQTLNELIFQGHPHWP